MVATGYAVAFRHYSSEYISAEESAKFAKRGIWAGTFKMPSEFRAASRGPGGQVSDAVRREQQRQRSPS
jgi:endonuclease YncB( thermonuclease family)